MYRCKNWFCARSNNNNYVDVALSEPGTLPAPSSATSTGTTTANSFGIGNARNNNNSSRRMISSTVPVRGLSLCDDSLPSAKNCYRLVMLGSSSRAGKSSIVARFLEQSVRRRHTRRPSRSSIANCIAYETRSFKWTFWILLAITRFPQCVVCHF
ncbi:GL25151 [Drosophila persimilis]|uniref:GL25151 n=1 Tax=Drosophila persimilis TaxID=7234 RepID=B4GR53_DROPE|nr:GL25151 [Drosophila persimilis]